MAFSPDVVVTWMAVLGVWIAPILLAEVVASIAELVGAPAPVDEPAPRPARSPG